MIEEVTAAVNFLARILHGTGRVNKDAVEQFRNSLADHLKGYYEGHWFPHVPVRGSGYRCIRINHIMDPILETAAKDSGISNLLSYFPNELTMWVDPYDVSYRIGENGSIGQIYAADTSSLSRHTRSDLQISQSLSADNTRVFGRGVLSTCKEQLREFASSKHASSVFTPFAAFVSS